MNHGEKLAMVKEANRLTRYLRSLSGDEAIKLMEDKILPASGIPPRSYTAVSQSLEDAIRRFRHVNKLQDSEIDLAPRFSERWKKIMRDVRDDNTQEVYSMTRSPDSAQKIISSKNPFSGIDEGGRRPHWVVKKLVEHPHKGPDQNPILRGDHSRGLFFASPFDWSYQRNFGNTLLKAKVPRAVLDDDPRKNIIGGIPQQLWRRYAKDVEILPQNQWPR
jgi:hypothetical protein